MNDLWTIVNECKSKWVVHGWCRTKGFWFRIKPFRGFQEAIAFTS